MVCFYRKRIGVNHWCGIMKQSYCYHPPKSSYTPQQFSNDYTLYLYVRALKSKRLGYWHVQFLGTEHEG